MATKTKTKSKTLPAVCPKCGSTQFKANLKGSNAIVRKLSGSIVGFAYRKVKWAKKRCECGQIITTRTYQN